MNMHKVLYWWIAGMAIMLLASYLVGSPTFVPFIAFTGFAGPTLRRRSRAVLA